jgi:hypothetical protein
MPALLTALTILAGGGALCGRDRQPLIALAHSTSDE